MQWDGVHTLVQRAKAEDPEAWRALEAMARDFMLGVAQRLLGPGWPHGSVSDLTQGAWLRVFRTFDEFEGGGDDAGTGAAFRAFLTLTMKRLHLNDRRHHSAARRRPPPGTVRAGAKDPDGSSVGVCDPPAGEPPPDVAAARSEEWDRIRRAVAALGEMERDIVERRYFRRQSLPDIAAAVALTADQVRYRLDRALARIGLTLREDHDHAEGDTPGRPGPRRG